MPEMDTRRSLDEINAALPHLDSPAFRELLESADHAELPPEVLARAYRELVQRSDDGGSEPLARAILERLFGNDEKGRLRHLRPLLTAARRRVPQHAPWEEAEDLFHDALALILEVLPGPRGRIAERAWHAFCHQRLIDAWRRRHGRRGERLEPPRGGDGEMTALLEAAALPPWHNAPGPDHVARLERLVRRVVGCIADPTVRAVAEDQWLSALPSPISARVNGRRPLTERLGKSRFQIYRALEAARARVRTEIERAPLSHGEPP